MQEVQAEIEQAELEESVLSESFNNDNDLVESSAHHDTRPLNPDINSPNRTFRNELPSATQPVAPTSSKTGRSAKSSGLNVNASP